MTAYFRPLAQSGPARPVDAQVLAGGQSWFTHAECIRRGRASEVIPADQVPFPVLSRLTRPRADVCGLAMNRPQIMGILNVTPDSFSDGGQFAAPEVAMDAARAMAEGGASIIDIGGESTRPGAMRVPDDEEIRRTAPIIASLRQACPTTVPISIDTRKAAVARAALAAGADLVNDVSGFTFDPELAPLCADLGAPICVMHAQGDPETMQERPAYDDVVLDVYDFLDRRIAFLESAGISRDRIVVDPGIGFGKTFEHNLELLRKISIFHGLGCAILIGVSRKGFIGKIGAEPDPRRRAPGSIAVALAALDQGVQFLRVHDVAETAQAVRLWTAVRQGNGYA